jgi:phosphohistidine swiveling domain-containing protein
MLPNKIKFLIKASKFCYVPFFIFFNKYEYVKKELILVNKIKTLFKKKIIIRSGFYNEDNKKSNAGMFESISNVNPKKVDEVKKSIEQIFKKAKNSQNDYVIIQDFIDKSYLSGVIFTRDPETSAPVITVNFKRNRITDSITSGRENGQLIRYFYDYKIDKNKKFINSINKLVIKIKKIFGDNLDIEFAYKKNKFYIFQVRKLYIKNKKINSVVYKKSLQDLNRKLLKLKSEDLDLVLSNKNHIYSTMTDWNPAEIIGKKPKNLSLSLYKMIITNDIWHNSRSYLGYKSVPYPLMYNFLGTPYVNIIIDFNSFLIDKISNSSKKKLLSYYVKELLKKPYFYHDKVESHLVLNCINKNFKETFKKFKKVKISKSEFRIIYNEYKNLTESIIFKLDENIKKYNKIPALLKVIKNKNIYSINKIYKYYIILKEHGTLPFANIARMSFVAMAFVNSIFEKRIISDLDKNNFLKSIPSVTRQFNDLVYKKNKKKIIKEFGHLRPNTYEINSKSYKENYNNYISGIISKPIRRNAYKFPKIQMNLINSYLKNIGFKNINSAILIKFIKQSIYHRERSKLFFSKIIDEIFNELKILFKRIRINEKYISYLNLETVINLHGNFSHSNIRSDIIKELKNNIKRYSVESDINMPNVILKPKDIFFYEEKSSSPTYVGKKNVIGEIFHLNELKKKNDFDLDDKIICIKHADPGYDFIFLKKIKGLITEFGGPNSHMYIRANEFNLPAAIGIGENKYLEVINSKKVSLNCNEKLISTV